MLCVDVFKTKLESQLTLGDLIRCCKYSAASNAYSNVKALNSPSQSTDKIQACG